MASKNKPESPQATVSDTPSNVSIDEVLRPFQDASAKFLQTNWSARESAIRDRTQVYLDFQEQVRSVEHEAYGAAIEATRRYLDKFGQQTTGSVEEMYATRMQSQLDYEKEVRQVYADREAKLRAIAQKASDETGGDVNRRIADQRQEAHQAYVADLQKAWSNIKTLEPQTMNAIASQILCTINMC